ncbi:MAG: hypothetical protein IJ509_03775 [Bacilli bacterium]|nr:hypothetical protein [Bacilli bacterium]
MNNSIDRERVTELTIDEWIWVVFIILSLLNIGGDELDKKYCFDHEIKEKELSLKIFTFTVFVSFLIYIYLAYKNCKKYRKAKMKNQDTSLISTRCFASILVVVASTMFLTAQLRDKVPTNPSLQ